MPWGEVILCFRHSDFSIYNRVAKALERVRKVCYNNTPEREWWSWFEVLKMGGMWLAKVARRGEISNAISKNFVGYCVGCEEL